MVLFVFFLFLTPGSQVLAAPTNRIEGNPFYYCRPASFIFRLSRALKGKPELFVGKGPGGWKELQTFIEVLGVGCWVLVPTAARYASRVSQGISGEFPGPRGSGSLEWTVCDVSKICEEPL
jgi:hypothetical protein